GRTDKTEGILRILPRRDGFFLRVISVARRRIDLRRYNRGRTVLRRNGFHHVRLSEAFCRRSIVSHGDFVELAIVEGEKNLFDAVRSNGSPGNVRWPPSELLNERWTAMNHLYIADLFLSALQQFGQAHSQCEVPIPRKILSTKPWRRKEQDDKTKNCAAQRFHF